MHIFLIQGNHNMYSCNCKCKYIMFKFWNVWLFPPLSPHSWESKVFTLLCKNKMHRNRKNIKADILVNVDQFYFTYFVQFHCFIFSTSGLPPEQWSFCQSWPLWPQWPWPLTPWPWFLTPWPFPASTHQVWWRSDHYLTFNPSDLDLDL